MGSSPVLTELIDKDTSMFEVFLQGAAFHTKYNHLTAAVAA